MREDWSQKELDLVEKYADQIRKKKLTYYRACQGVVEELQSMGLQRTFEAVRSQLKKKVGSSSRS